MKVLAGCEKSGIVRDAFLAAGHDAYSCDTEPSTIFNYDRHIQGDVRDILQHGWDLAIFFPPCNDLAASGAQYWTEKQKDGRQKAAIDFVLELVGAPIPKIAIENPVGILSTMWRRPDQIIDPYQFGDPFTKKTCLWLKGLPLLVEQNKVEPLYTHHSGSSRGGPRKNGSRKQTQLSTRYASRTAEGRARFWPGIAQAMAEQWGATK